MGKSLEDIKALGLEIVPEKQFTPNLMGVDNLNEVTDLLLDITISAIRKEGITGYLEHAFEVFPAISGLELVGNEVLNMDQSEWESFVARVETKLTQNLPEFNLDEVVKLSEDIAYHLVGIGVNIYKLLSLKK